MSHRFIALLYHDVYRDGAVDYGRLGRSTTMYHIPLDGFRAQLDRIAGAGLEVLGLSDVRASFASGSRAERRGVAICFDDGWDGALSWGADELAARDHRAFFFVTTALTGRRWFADAARLRSLDPSRFTIGSHGATHRMLSSLPASDMRAELQDSKRVLEDVLGRPVTSLSVPGGAVSRAVVDAAREIGYTEVFDSAIGVNPTRRGRWGIARLGVSRATDHAVLDRWLAFKLGRDRARKAVYALPKTMIGMRLYSKLRRTLLGEARGYEHFFEP